MSKRKREIKLFEPALVNTAIKQSFVKLSPRLMVKNPVMFTVEIGTFVMLAVVIWQMITHDTTQGALWYNIVVFAILLITVVFANFAEALAEARGKAQAESLRKTREETPAKKVELPGDIFVKEIKVVPSSQLRLGDRFVCETGDVIPMDGEIVEGIATIDESAITGESAPVIRESGGDKSSVTGGTKVLSDRIVVQVTTQPGETFLDKMIALVECCQQAENA
jgi:potassium-transporting ATPase ATP-binding subunit